MYVYPNNTVLLVDEGTIVIITKFNEIVNATY